MIKILIAIVKDEGIGISRKIYTSDSLKDFLEQIRAKSKEVLVVLGLGLAIVKHISDHQHRAEMNISSD